MKKLLIASAIVLLTGISLGRLTRKPAQVQVVKGVKVELKDCTAKTINKHQQFL